MLSTGHGSNDMRKLAVAALALLTLIGSATAEPEKIGTATLIRTAVNGDYGEIVVKEPIHRNERIRTSKSGLGEFLFRDGTKLAVGWGSNIVVDSFVFDDSGSVKKLTLKAARGTFRWISGKSKSTAYQINTPSGTIGVRGTKFDFYVGPDGTTAVVLLSGAAQFCGSGGCVQLRNRCDCVIAKRGTRPAVSRANRQVLDKLGSARALPFLSNNQTLSGGFGPSSGCGMSVAALQAPNNNRETKARAARENSPTPSVTSPRPEKPNRPNTPGTPGQHNVPDTPNTPDKPSEPDKPNQDPPRDHPEKPDKDGDNLPDVEGVNEGSQR